MNEEQTMIIGGITGQISGAELRSCHSCNNRVWFAPTGLTLISQGAKPTCMRCAVAQMSGDDRIKLDAVNNDQIRELEENDVPITHQLDKQLQHYMETMIANHRDRS